MRDKRPVDELSVAELERVLAIKRREERMARFRHGGQDTSRAVTVPPTPPAQPSAPSSPSSTEMVSAADFDSVQFVDDLGRSHNNSNPQVWRGYTSILLLVVEVTAVFGLVYILYQSFIGLEDIQTNTNETQRELEAIREQGRMTATPLPDLTPGSLVIPGGHTAPDANGQSSFNYSELDRAFEQQQIPQSIRPAIERQAVSYRPASQSRQPTDPLYVTIPELGIRQSSIVNGTSWDMLREGIGWFNNGARPGGRQNVVLLGHNDIYGEIFRNLHLLEKGDTVEIGTATGVHTYRVTNTQIVEPDQIEVMDPNNGAQLTLITCYPYQVDTQRFVVFAELVE
ncbi:MAG: class D sortase [Anaerolineales bacterium]|nr:class D sortase [Anaerolineales bacterium]